MGVHLEDRDLTTAAGCRRLGAALLHAAELLELAMLEHAVPA